MRTLECIVVLGYSAAEIARLVAHLWRLYHISSFPHYALCEYADVSSEFAIPRTVENATSSLVG